MRLKKLTAYVLLSVMLWGTFIAPARAFVPLVLWGAGVIIDYTVAAIGVDLVATLPAGLAMGAYVIGITLKDPSDPSTGEAAPLMVMLDTQAELPNRPPGYSAPAAGSVQPTPPASITGGIQNTWTNSPIGNNYTTAWSSLQAACDEATAVHNGGVGSLCGTATWVPAGSTSSTNYCKLSGSSYGSCNPSAAYTPVFSNCNAGYDKTTTAYPNTVCTLQNASQVQKGSTYTTNGKINVGDGKRAIVRTGNTFAADPQDTFDPIGSGITVTSSSVTAQSGTGKRVIVSLNADGTSQLINIYPNSDGLTSTQATTHFSAPDSNGHVVKDGQSTSILQGTGASAAPATPVPAGIDPVTQAPYVAGQGSLSGSGSGTATFDKSGLATDSGQATTNSKLDDLKNDLQPGTSTVGTAQPNIYTKDTKTFSDVFTNFKNTVQGSAFFTQATSFFTITLGGTCPIWTVSLPIFSVTFDQFCGSLMESAWPYIRTAVLIVFSFIAFTWAFL